MTLADLSTLGSLISSLAVAASLVYLGLQTHQAAKHTKALIHQGRVTQILEMTSSLLEPELVALILKKNGENPTAEAIENNRFALLFSRMRFSWEDSFSQYRSGLLSADSFATTRARIVTNLSQSGFRAQWDQTKVKGTEFTAYVDALLSKLPPSIPSKNQVD